MTRREVDPQKVTAPRIKQRMAEKHLTQNQLAELSGLGLSTIKQYTSGQRLPGKENMKKLSAVLDVTEEWLRGGKYRTVQEEFNESLKEFEATVDYKKLRAEIKQIHRFYNFFDFGSDVQTHYTKYVDDPTEGKVITDSLENHLTEKQLKAIRKQVEGFIYYTVDQEIKKGENK